VRATATASTSPTAVPLDHGGSRAPVPNVQDPVRGEGRNQPHDAGRDVHGDEVVYGFPVGLQAVARA
jgi:hypothetical protein